MMQIKDVIGAFNVGFDLELDCEYDSKNRSLIASNSYLNSKIFVINNIKQNTLVSDNVRVNTIVINFDNLDRKIIEQILSDCVGVDEDDKFKLAISSGDILYTHEDKFSLSKIDKLGVKYTLAYAN
jgi:hypothetical protein